MSGVYRTFKIHEDEVEGVINTWIDVLDDVTLAEVRAVLPKLCRCEPYIDFAPSPGAIYQACMDSGVNLTVYQIQQREQEQRMLELKEYHETEQVGPMPDSVRERLDKVFKKARVIQDES